MTHYSDSRRWSPLHGAWVLTENWTQADEIAALKAENAALRIEVDRLQTKATAAVDRTRDLERALAERAGGVKVDREDFAKFICEIHSETWRGGPDDGYAHGDELNNVWRYYADEIVSYLTTEAAAPEGRQESVSIVPEHCSGSSLVFSEGILHVNKDGSGHIVVKEADFQMETEYDDDGARSDFWITRFPAGEMQVLKDFLNGVSLTRPAEQAVTDGLLAKMSRHLNWELDWGSLDPSDESSECAWRVHRRSGGRNDREWTLLGTGDTPAAALAAALAVKP